jgi:hypothetical protein
MKSGVYPSKLPQMQLLLIQKSIFTILSYLLVLVSATLSAEGFNVTANLVEKEL